MLAICENLYFYCQVRYRQWYRDKTAGEAVAERTLATMRFGTEDNPLGATLEIVPGKKNELRMIKRLHKK